MVSMRELNAIIEQRLVGVHKDCQLIVKDAIKYSNIYFGIADMGGKRTPEEQNALFKKRKSNLDGYTLIGKHQKGETFDVVPYLPNGKPSFDPIHVNILAGCIMETANKLFEDGRASHRLRWGGSVGSDDYDGWDKFNLELIME